MILISSRGSTESFVCTYSLVGLLCLCCHRLTSCARQHLKSILTARAGRMKNSTLSARRTWCSPMWISRPNTIITASAQRVPLEFEATRGRMLAENGPLHRGTLALPNDLHLPHRSARPQPPTRIDSPSSQPQRLVVHQAGRLSRVAILGRLGKI